MHGTNRRLPGISCGQLEETDVRSVGHRGVGIWVSDPIHTSSSTFRRASHSAGIQSPLHQGEGSFGRGPQPYCKGSSGTSSPFSGFLQPPICCPKSLGSMEASDRSLSSEQVCSEDKVQTWRPSSRSFPPSVRTTGCFHWTSKTHTSKFQYIRPAGSS